MDFSFENILSGSENILMYNNNSYKECIELKREYIRSLKTLEETIDTFRSLNSENIILKDYKFETNILCVDDYRENIYKINNYIDYLHEIIYILIIRKNRDYKYISSSDKMVSYLIFG